MVSGIERLVKSTLRRVAPWRRAESGFHSQNLNPFLSLLKSLDFEPRHIIDVGANHGDWTRTALQFFSETAYTLVEPQGHLKSCIQDLVDEGYKINWITAGAGERSGRFFFTIAARDDCSTFALSKEEADVAGAKQVEVEVMTLNQIVAASGRGIPELVKIDAERLDLQVLAGATDLLGTTDIFLVEAAVCAPVENSVAEVLRFMDKTGYQLIDITDLNRSPKHGVLWLCELAFLKKGSTLLDPVKSYE
jgi:FkbM family methyltransferase